MNLGFRKVQNVRVYETVFSDSFELRSTVMMRLQHTYVYYLLIRTYESQRRCVIKQPQTVTEPEAALGDHAEAVHPRQPRPRGHNL